MASRITSLSLVADATFDRVRDAFGARGRGSLATELHRVFWPSDRSLLDRLIRLVWLPWWLWSDWPGPPPARRARIAAPALPVGVRFLSLLGKVQRKQSINHLLMLLVRGLSLTFVGGSIWTIVALNGGPMISSTSMVGLGAVLVLLSLIYAVWYRPGPRETAAMVDRSFQLADRITTAVDHVGEADRTNITIGRIRELQQVEAINTLAILSKRPGLRIQAPIREMVGVVALGLFLLALYLLNGTGSGLPALQTGSVPAFVAAKDRLKPTEKQAPAPASSDTGKAPSVAGVQQKADLSASAEADLNKLADALDDNPLTSSISDAIRAGDYDKAASELAAIAPQLDQLSPDLQNDLADNLDAAAAAMSGDNPDLANATQKAADALHGEDSAEPSLSDLSSAIQTTGDSIESQQDLAGQMKDAREAEANDSASRDTRPEPGDPQTQAQDGEEQIASDGGDAASGSGSNKQSGNQQSQNTGGSGSDGQDQSDSSAAADSGNASTQPDAQSSGSSQDSPGASGPSDSSNPSQSGAGSSSNGAQSSGKQDPQTQESDGANADSQPGNGAGKGSGGDQVPGDRQSSNGASQSAGDRAADSPDPDVQGEGSSGTVDSNGDPVDPSETITLSRAPDTSGYKSGGSSSSSSGSGSGAAAGPGSVDQGDVGEAGPDSNRVPDQYKSIVEDYFSDGP